MFDQVHLRGRELVAIQPNIAYQPLFAYADAEEVRKCRESNFQLPNSWSQTTFVAASSKNAIYREENL